jgi:glycerol uptake facilitator protein
MHPFVYEFLGTAVLILLGNGVVANVVLNDTKGHNSGWIVITFGWAMAVFMGVMVSSKGSGSHLNPAVTLTMAYLGRMEWSLVPEYLLGQLAGAMAGSFLVYLSYKKHFDVTDNPHAKLACFCTHPAIRSPVYNFLSEAVGTFVLILGVLYIASPASSMGSIEALPVSLLVLAIGLSLGGTTGYAINPARDFGPRLTHFLLPMKNKMKADWSYAWIPVLGPVAGGLLATWLYHFLSTSF